MLTNLRLRNFRCFEGVSVNIGPGFNLFLGANGEGKTTILEAACVLLRLQSQRSSSLAPVIEIGKKFFEVRGRFEEHELEFRYSALRRRVKFDEIEQRTLSEYLRIGRVVSLANADIELVRGGSEARRRYLDFLGAQIDGSYRPALRAYERALRARNALLKSPMLRAREVAAYDAPLIEHGRVLLRQTIVGPHRDDLELLVDDLPAAQFASEGQQRTIVLAMKIAQAETLKTSSEGKAPLLLIDDIFGELDHERRNALLDNLPTDSQKLVTATAMLWRDEITADTIYEMRDRRLRRM